jgi:hypothetical protein
VSVAPVFIEHFFIFKVNGQNLAKEFCDRDIADIWEGGLGKSPQELSGFAQYKLPSGVLRLVYTLIQKVNLGITLDYVLILLLYNLV